MSMKASLDYAMVKKYILTASLIILLALSLTAAIFSKASITTVCRFIACISLDESCPQWNFSTKVEYLSVVFCVDTGL